jgi:hypothetical protein
MNRNGWRRIPRNLPCPACGHKGFCTIAPDGTEVKCMRDTSGRPCKPDRDGKVGYMHPVSGESLKMTKAIAKAMDAPKLTVRECVALQKRLLCGMTDAKVNEAASVLGVSVKALRDLGIGLDGAYARERCTGYWSFPMFNSRREIIGFSVRERIADGANRRCIPGSSLGLFIPASFDAESLADVDRAGFGYSKVLLLPEGPTDVAAARSLGFMAIGRPSCNGGATMLCALIRNLPCAIEAIIVADRDYTHFLRDGTPYWPGWEGALSVANQLMDVKGTRKVISLKRISAAKDIRQWLNAGRRVRGNRAGRRSSDARMAQGQA